jgi:hypothetical protein
MPSRESSRKPLKTSDPVTELKRLQKKKAQAKEKRGLLADSSMPIFHSEQVIAEIGTKEQVRISMENVR